MLPRRRRQSRATRRASSRARLPTVVSLLASLLLVLPALPAPTAAAVGAGSDGPGIASAARDNPDFIDIPASCAGPEGLPKAELCRLVPQQRGATTIVLWGDSHAWHLVPALRAAVQGKKLNLVLFEMGGCPPMYAVLRDASSSRPSNGCDRFGNKVVDWLRARVREGRPIRLVLGTSWELYHDVYAPPNRSDELFPGLTNDWVTANALTSRQAMPRLFRTLGRLGVRTDIIGQMPMAYVGSVECAQGATRCDRPRSGMIKDPAQNNARMYELRRHLSKPGLIIRPAKALCDDAVCHGTVDGLPVFWDPFHIGQRTSLRLAPFFAPTVAGALRMNQRRGVGRSAGSS